MAFSQSQLDSLEAAIAQGATEVKYGDKTVVYRSVEEMLELRELMRKELGQISPQNRIYTKFSKGF